MGANVKRMQKAIKLLSKESAALEVEKLKARSPPPSYALIKRTADECDANEFQNTVIRELKASLPDIRAVIVFMEDKPTSQVSVCSSDDDLLKRIATALCDVLEIKLGTGGLICKNGRFQAKFTNAKHIKKCDQVVADLVQQ